MSTYTAQLLSGGVKRLACISSRTLLAPLDSSASSLHALRPACLPAAPAQQKRRLLSGCNTHSLPPLPPVTRYVDMALAPEGISLVAIHPGMPRCAVLCCAMPCCAVVLLLTSSVLLPWSARGAPCLRAWQATVASVSICAVKPACQPPDTALQAM